MSKTFKVGVIGFGHMHINDIMRRFNETPGTQWVACTDTVPDVPETTSATFTRAWNLKYAHETIGIPRVYADYREMLDREKFDLVLIYSENARHAELVEAVAARGNNMVVEKPMADSLFSALRMVRAARQAGVILAINWPSTWSPAVRKVKELIDAGVIGKPYQFKFRAAHTGPLGAGAQHQGVAAGDDLVTDADRNRAWWYRAGTGGGALLDFCSYGACLSRWYFGEPAVAAAGLAANLGSPYAEIEDNAIVSVRFPSAIALLEASWTTLDNAIPAGPIIYGSEGTLVVEDMGGARIRIARGHGAEPEIVEAEPLPAGRTSIAGEMFHHLSTGEPLHITLQPEFNLDAMAILDAGARSASSGKLEPVNNQHWCLR